MTETKPKRYQCRHIFTDGHRCGSICLRGEEFCYYHHTTRKPAQNPRTRRNRQSTFDLPVTDPNDRTGLQSTIIEVLRRIAANDIDPRRAGLLLYGLQIASLNLPKPQTAKQGRQTEQPETVEEITTHPELGILAPKTDIDEIPINPKSAIGLLLEVMSTKAPEQSPTTPQSTTLPTLQANAESDKCLIHPVLRYHRTEIGPRPYSAFSTFHRKGGTSRGRFIRHREAVVPSPAIDTANRMQSEPR
jgi:hypothetical protein